MTSNASQIDTTIRYRAAATDALAITPFDTLDALYDRRSGLTHLVAEPIPAILTALADGPASEAELIERLAATFDIEGDTGALSARLTELVALGLVEAC